MNHTLTTYSDTALNGAIRDLTFSRQWASRLRELLVERDRRRGKTRNKKQT
jgi:hypothetical protein